MEWCGEAQTRFSWSSIRIWILTISDLKVKYQSSYLGFAWSFLNPILMMLPTFRR